MRPSLLALAAALMLTSAATATHAQTTTTQNSTAPAALARPAVDDTVFIYVDYVTGLDNLINTIPRAQFRNNITAFAKFNPLFRVPTIVLGEENDYYGTFLPEIRQVIDAGARTFKPRSTPTGYNSEFAEWLASTGRRIETSDKRMGSSPLGWFRAARTSAQACRRRRPAPMRRPAGPGRLRSVRRRSARLRSSRWRSDCPGRPPAPARRHLAEAETAPR